MLTAIPKRKIVTIVEDDENNLHPKFSKDRKSCSVKSSNRSVTTEYKQEKLSTSKKTSRLFVSPKYVHESKTKSKLNKTQITRETNVLKPVNNRKCSNISNERNPSHDSKDGSRSFRNSNISKTNIPKYPVNNVTSKSTNENEKSLSLVNTQFIENVRTNASPKNDLDKSRSDKTTAQIINSNVMLLKEIKKNKPVTVIHVPLDEKFYNTNLQSQDVFESSLSDAYKEIESKCLIDVNVGTSPPPVLVDQVTDMNDCDYPCVKKSLMSKHIQTEVTKGSLDSLEIPNVSLTKDKFDLKKEKSKLTSDVIHESLNRTDSATDSVSICTSYIISRSTLTYTEQKINFHGVETDDAPQSRIVSPLTYPVSVMSVYKNEKKKNKIKLFNDDVRSDINDRNKQANINVLNECKELNCSYALDGNKLMKPSDIIKTIRVSTELLQSEYICEQFLKELNFIDSFFESLQYLENSSLSAKCLINESADSLSNNPILLKNVFYENAEYGAFITNLDSCGNVEDTETMASNSLCLLNSLIRDEQRRAKNLLFVLKMREDALKEYATSQILWLENKKKHDNTDVSVLKKKQRGALLKLQHECGEMQRMRKTLLTLSEKRKIALMKTKKSLELKLRNNVDVEQIVLGKKKLKKNMSADRNTAPLKCFDLSSSGCEDSSTSRHTADVALMDTDMLRFSVKKAEKSIQTGDSIIGSLLVDQSTDTAAENFVVVDGGYLNILFHNLSLPQIFSGGKQYEVNEEALKNIVNSSNTNNSDSVSKRDMLEKLMDKSRDLDRSSSPSTAHSLVEEFDQYYKRMHFEKSPVETSVAEVSSPEHLYETKDTSLQVSEFDLGDDDYMHQTAMTMTSEDVGVTASLKKVFLDQACMCEGRDLVCSLVKDEPVVNPTGPLPVPVGAAAVSDTSVVDIPVWPLTKSTSTSTTLESSVDSLDICANVPSVSSLTSPVQCEAEELRRQQLAIEREIKALEQQQCQLLVVREIPDKPPPPYTPPMDSRTSKPPSIFLTDTDTEEKIRNQIIEPSNVVLDSNDAFDMFLKDFCQESMEMQKLEHTDKPWDACNLLPQKPQTDTEKLIQKTSSELLDVLTGVMPTVVSGVGARRSDHVDDILFAEWRRCEPEWTSLHTDEALVKNQIFDSIFQKILTETIDEYKKICTTDQ